MSCRPAHCPGPIPVAVPRGFVPVPLLLFAAGYRSSQVSSGQVLLPAQAVQAGDARNRSAGFDILPRWWRNAAMPPVLSG